MKIYKLDIEKVKECFKNYPGEIGILQTVVYVMVGGGMLGQFATHQPADFYIDDRVGRLPYSRAAIYQAVAVLVALAEAKGLDPHRLPIRPAFHACGIF